MAALQTTVRVLKDEFLNQDMYMSFMQQSGTIGRIRALVLQARGLGPDPGLDAALRSFLLLAKSMEELFMRREDVKRECFAVETELDFKKDALEAKRKELREELEGLEFRRRQLDRELAVVRRRYNVVREYPPF